MGLSAMLFFLFATAIPWMDKHRHTVYCECWFWQISFRMLCLGIELHTHNTDQGSMCTLLTYWCLILSVCVGRWGQAGSSDYHVYSVLSRVQSVQWGLWGWRGVWHGQQHWKHQRLGLFGPNKERQVSHNNMWERAVIYVSWGVQFYVTIKALYTLMVHCLLYFKCNPSHLTCSASASVISGEEQFEDYGEGEDVDFIPSSPCPEDDNRTNGFSDLGSSLPSRLVVRLDTHTF